MMQIPTEVFQLKCSHCEEWMTVSGPFPRKRKTDPFTGSELVDFTCENVECPFLEDYDAEGPWFELYTVEEMRAKQGEKQ